MVVALLVVLAIAVPALAAQDRPALTTTTFARARQPGEVVRVDISCVCNGATPTATVFERDLPLSSEGANHWRGLVGIDLDTAPGIYPITVTLRRPGQAPEVHDTPLDVGSKQFPVRRLRVAGRFVDPPASARPRIEREARRLDTLFATSTPGVWHQPFRPPVKQKPVSNFGARSVFNGRPRNPHGGVDFGSPTGTPVAAPSSGRVALAAPLYFTGNTVIIDHGQGIYSLLAHLSKYQVEEGDVVPPGAIVGRVGATGRVTGPHLHWTVRLRGARVDPLSLIAAAR